MPHPDAKARNQLVEPPPFPTLNLGKWLGIGGVAAGIVLLVAMVVTLTQRPEPESDSTEPSIARPESARQSQPVLLDRIPDSPIAASKTPPPATQPQRIQPAQASAEATGSVEQSNASTGVGSSKTVHVSGYTRKDGTYVKPYNRRAPRR